jgi:hypothetical protein
MLDRKDMIDKELKLLYADEKDLADRIQDLLQEKLQIQRQEDQHRASARLKSKHGIGTR